MKIELLYFDGCPSYKTLLPRLHDLLAHAGVNGSIEQRRVETRRRATRAVSRLADAPGGRLRRRSGRARSDDYGLKSRLYPVAGGLPGTPPDEWILKALRRVTDHWERRTEQCREGPRSSRTMPVMA